MNKKGIAVLILALLSCGGLITGCSAGNVSVGPQKPKEHRLTKSEKKKIKEEDKQAAKRQAIAKQKARGKEYTYALPKGSSWIYIYDNGEKTDSHLDPDTNNTVKLHENDKIKYGGELPLVGHCETGSDVVNANSAEATMDDSDKYDKSLNFKIASSDNFSLKVMDHSLKNADFKGISQMVFADLPKYLDAAGSNDPSKLPNQSPQLVKSLTGTNYQGDAKASYQVIEQYFDKRSGDHDDKLFNGNQADDDHATYVEIGDDSLVDLKSATQLFVDVFAKVKKTDTDPHAARYDDGPQYGSSSTKLQEYQMDYELVDNKWQLISVFKEDESDFSMDTSKSNWIVQKY
ncbi:hypothetical protein [Companilactobacillus musae]|uniref:hypothetical protein n=1 Tax=Companilactobacillus musae TaxID=1903258 RepID=UPI000E65CA09|nr:hypothetical protein [Companilactobacillus musae]